MAGTRPLVALQLYTVREATAQDMIGTLRRVAELGYEGVELAGPGNATIEEIASALRELNLKCVGSHTLIDALQNDLDNVLQTTKWLGHRHIVCPWISEDWRSAEGYKKLGAALSEIGAQVKQYGLQVCYHNHDFEFAKYDGETGFDILYGNSDPDLLHAEIDTFWVQKAGYDPAVTINKYARRAALIHLKDMDESGNFAPVGAGMMDWEAVFEVADHNAVAYIVEQDSCVGDPFESVETSIKNLKSWGKLD